MTSRKYLRGPLPKFSVLYPLTYGIISKRNSEVNTDEDSMIKQKGSAGQKRQIKFFHCYQLQAGELGYKSLSLKSFSALDKDNDISVQDWWGWGKEITWCSRRCTPEIWSLDWWIVLFFSLKSSFCYINIAYLWLHRVTPECGSSPLTPFSHLNLIPPKKFREVEKAIAGNSIIILEQIKSIESTRHPWLTTAAPPKLKL